MKTSTCLLLFLLILISNCFGQFRVKGGRGAQPHSSVDPKDVKMEKMINIAIVVGTDNYANWGQLQNPVFDAQTIASELTKDYGYQVVLLIDPKKDQILDVLDSVSNLLSHLDSTVNSSLFIFIAGHGGYDNYAMGYIVPSDARSAEQDKHKESYITYSDLRDRVDNIPARHILVSLDVCFGGTFDQLVSMGLAHRGDDDYGNVDFKELIIRKQDYKSRLYVTSGGKEYVPDGRPQHHSPFAYRLIDLMINNADSRKPITYHSLCSELELVTPEPRAGHFGIIDQPGSDYLFIPVGLMK
jgi:Caspase domain